MRALREGTSFAPADESEEEGTTDGEASASG